MDVSALQAALQRFAEERKWQRFHTPKNLAMALAVEAAELLEHFQWLTPEESIQLADVKKQEVAEEIADVFLYLARLADVMDVDLEQAAYAKMKKNAVKYPPEG